MPAGEKWLNNEGQNSQGRDPYPLDVCEEHVSVIEGTRRLMFLEELMPYGGIAQGNTAKN